MDLLMGGQVQYHSQSLPSSEQPDELRQTARCYQTTLLPCLSWQSPVSLPPSRVH